MTSWILGGLCYGVFALAGLMAFGSLFAINDGDQQPHTGWVAAIATIVSFGAYYAGQYFLPFN